VSEPEHRWLPYLALAGLALAWGEERISSGLASTLNATTPLFAAVFVYWVIPTERPSPLNYAGVLVGLAGVAILVLPEIAAGGIRGDAIGTWRCSSPQRPMRCRPSTSGGGCAA
jgi:drug/metabolite transporter (DMT)-like permease